MKFKHYFKSRQGEMVNLLKNLVSLVKTVTTNIFNGGLITKPRWRRMFKIIC